MKNTSTDLKNILFTALEGLLDKDEPLDLERAKVIVDTCQTMVNATKNDIEYMKLKLDYAKVVAKSDQNSNLLAANVDHPFLEPKDDYLPNHIPRYGNAES